MAIALGYGVLCAAIVTLFLVPCGYVIMDDLMGARDRKAARTDAPPEGAPPVLPPPSVTPSPHPSPSPLPQPTVTSTRPAPSPTPAVTEPAGPTMTRRVSDGN